MNIEDSLLKSIAEEAINWRRLLHQNPQTCYEETFASEFIAQKLREFGIETEVGLAKTGVVGRLAGKLPGNKKIGLRADIDALDIHEENNFEYKSKYPGKMHACGHDGHTAMLLAAAKYLATNRNFAGEVYFIFQPAEEGGAGGERMIKEGLFDKFPADSVWGMHNTPGIATGAVGLMSGTMLASADEFKIKVSGKGGHAAMPHTTIDPILAASHLVTALHSVVSRNIKPTTAGVITIGCFNSGTASNIIPDTAELAGTVRALDETTRVELLNRVEKISQDVASAFGAKAVFDKLPNGYPVLVNTEAETDLAEAVAKKTLLETFRLDAPVLGAEDFSFMLQKKPGCYIFLGNGKFGEKGGHQLHTAKYDFNDDILIQGAAYWVELVRSV